MRQLTPILLANLALLTFGLPPSAIAQNPSSTVNRWTRTADLTAARSAACAVVLNDGRLMVAGGLGDSGPVGAVDIYGTDGSFSAGPPMLHARASAACVTLPDGRVLVAGGNDGSGSLSSAELFDPSTNQWQPTGSLSVAREGHRMAVNSWGWAWVAGGTSNGVITGSLEQFDPNTGKFQAVGALNTARAEFAMTPLGRSLVIAGGTDGTNTLTSVEVYDGSLGTLTVAGAMSQARKDFAASALLDGTILMTGGLDVNGTVVNSTEIFDPVKGTSVAGPSLNEPRAYHSAFAMPGNGSVLIYGGAGNTGILGTTELYTPWTGSIAEGSPLNSARRDEAKAALSAGNYMVAGGRNDLGFLSGSELFRFSTITTDKGDYAPGTAVKISGGGWIPGEQVLVTITAFPVDQHHIEFTGAAVADGAGNITVPGFAVDKSHLGMKFLMSATGSQSQAQTTFTDGIDPTISYGFNPANNGSTPPGTSVAVTVTLTSQGNPTATGTITPCSPEGSCPTNLTVTGATCHPNKQCDLSGGSVTFNITIPSGPTDISVVYSGDSNYNFETPGNNAPIVTYNSQYYTVTDLTGGPASPAPYGTQTPYVANVCISTTSGGSCLGSGTLSGTVQFSVNGTPSGSPVAVTMTSANSGKATANFIPSTPLAVGGPYVITASYSGDSSNASSTSSTANGGAASISTTINSVSTTTSFTFTPASPIVYGQPISANITVASNVVGSGTPTGTVTVTVDNVAFASNVALTNGSVTVPLSSTLSASGSPHTVSVAYTPTAGTGYLSSSGGPSNITVNKANTTAGAPAYQTGDNTVFQTTPIYVSVVVTGSSPSTANPTSGTVTVFDASNGNVQLGSPTSVGDVGSLNCPTGTGTNVACIQVNNPPGTKFTAGNHNLYAVYNGDGANFNSSAPSSTQNLSIAPTVATAWGTPTQTLPLSGNATFGGALTLQGSVVAQTGFTSPDGHVTFIFDNNVSNPVNAVVNTTSNTNSNPYTAFFAIQPSTTVLGGGAHTVYTTSYQSTSGAFTAPVASNSSTFSFTINPATANFTISSSNTIAGQQVAVTSPVALTATYSSNPQLSPAPTGTITFYNSFNGGTSVTAPICTATLAAGVATCNPNPVAGPAGPAGLQAGTVNVAIAYAGDNNYTLGTTNAFNFTVTKAATLTQLVATPADGAVTAVGHRITLTATTTTQGLTYTPTGALTITVPATNVLAGSSTCGTPTPGASTATSITVSCAFTVTGPVPAAGTSVTATANYAFDGYTSASSGQASMQLTQDTTTTTLSLSNNPDAPNPTFIGHTVTLSATTTNSTSGASVQPNWQSISITPPAGNFSASTCATPTHVVASDTATSVTVTCTFTVKGPLGTGSINANASYASDTPSGTGASTAPTLAIPIQDVATSTVLTATSDTAQPFEMGRTVTLKAVVTTVTPNASVQPAFGNITITPPAGNASNSTCATPAHNPAQDTATSVTVTCTFLLTGASLPNPASVSASASYAVDNTVGTLGSGPASLTIQVQPAVTTTTLTATLPPGLNTPLGSDSPSGTVQLGRVVMLTATAKTLTNGAGVSLEPAGKFIFTLPNNAYINPSCNPAATQSGNTFTVTPAAANMSVLPYSATGPNQGTTTVTCTFTVVPPANTVAGAVGLDAYGVTYNNAGSDTLTAASSANTSITTVVDGTSMAACVSTTGGTCNASGNVYTYGQTISFNSTLSSNTTLPADTGYQPTNTVTFNGSGGLNDVTSIAPTPTGGTAAWSVPSLPPAIGAYTVNVTYAKTTADPYYASSTTPVTFTVNQAHTKTAIQGLSVPSGVPNLKIIVYNSSIANSGNPTGTVQAVAGGTASSSDGLISGGSVVATGFLSPSSSCNGLATSCSVATVLVSTGSYGADYLGDSNFLSSNSIGGAGGGSSPVNSVIATSSVTVSFAPSPASPGAPVTITATVQGQNGNSAPTGSVSFTDNGVLIGVAPVGNNGVAVFTYTPGPGSSHTIVATYSGDITYPSASFSSGLTVTKLTATTPSSVNGTATVYGQAVNLSVRIAPGPNQAGAPIPTGTVQFFVVNGSNIGTAVTLTNGSATLPYTGFPPGTYAIGVTYSGDNSFNGFGGAIGTITVSQAQVTVTLGTPTTSSGQMTLTATLSVVAPGAGTPTGTVAFNDATTGATLGTANVSGGSATATIPVTSDPIVAVYSGDTDFLGASSASTAPAVTITALNAASDVAAFSADTIISIYGSGLTSQTVTGTLPLQTNLGGMTVTVTDSAGVPRQALLFFVSPGQINLLIPAGTAVGPATITVNTGSGSLTTTINIASSTAALFTANNNGSGPLAAQVVAVAPGGQQTYVDTAASSGTTFVNAPISLSPAADTFYLLLYGTGFDTAKAVTVTINGQTYTPSYFGPQGGFAGLDQVNVLLPASLAGSGQVNVSITVDGQTSNVGSIAFGPAGTN